MFITIGRSTRTVTINMFITIGRSTITVTINMFYHTTVARYVSESKYEEHVNGKDNKQKGQTYITKWALIIILYFVE